MLIHALFDNKAPLVEGINFYIYSSYFNNDFAFFNNNTPILTGITKSMESIQSATLNNFPQINNISLQLNYGFYAKRTGTYRFYTRSKDASYLVIDGSIVVDNGSPHAAQNRFANINMTAGQYYSIIIFYGITAQPAEFSAGFMEPNADGSNNNSTNIDDFTKNIDNLNICFTSVWSFGGGTFSTTLTYTNPSLYGRYKINIISLLIDRTNFTSGKDDLLYVRSPQLYQPGSGTLFLVLHEEPVSSDFVRKDYHLFSDDFEIVTELNGYIEMVFTRGNPFGSTSAQRALLVMQAEKI